MKAKSKVSQYKKKVVPENSVAIERLERLFEIIKKSNSWKSKYEYFQLAKDVNENSIIISET